ncbi:hypothetical protein C1H69_22090 [Billgrantia endophytica]|uniref:Uncharacterized protein n=2 Tax=Billgrantia endophytica TaxID=2033802 RepID=A0A2N7TV74_9GAMM|nr:hypothetical protein C1H69_22090 [Halomonas endophytica]
MMRLIELTLAHPPLASRHASAAGALQRAAGATTIAINTPAKPMWTSVLTLKLRGFFIVRDKTRGHPSQEMAS